MLSGYLVLTASPAIAHTDTGTTTGFPAGFGHPVGGLGCLIAAGQKMPTVVAMLLVGLMAVFHGHAHGTEMPVNANGFEYGIGFVVATAILHIAGIGLSIIVQTIGRKAAPVAVRLGGGIIAATGTVLFTL